MVAPIVLAAGLAAAPSILNALGGLLGGGGGRRRPGRKAPARRGQLGGLLGRQVLGLGGGIGGGIGGLISMLGINGINGLGLATPKQQQRRMIQTPIALSAAAYQQYYQPGVQRPAVQPRPAQLQPPAARPTTNWGDYNTGQYYGEPGEFSGGVYIPSTEQSRAAAAAAGASYL